MKKNKIQELEIHVPVKENKLLSLCLDKINKNKEIYTLWKVMNVNAIERLGMSDHGVVYFQIVSNIALRLARILKKHKVVFSIEKYFKLSYDYAELVIFLASIMHDLGMSINREGREEFSLFLTDGLLKEILDFLPTYERVIVKSEVLHSIIAHRKGGKPQTLEAGIVRVSDALDMGEDRSRIPYKAGNIGIYSISDTAINSVEIKEGNQKDILINIEMNNSAGIYQVDELLKGKIKGSGLEKYIEVKAFIKSSKEKKLIKEIIIKDL